MRRRMATAAFFVGGAIIFYLLIVGFNLLSGPPEGLGVTDGRLADVPASPNAVSTFATDDEHGMSPISINRTSEGVMERVVKVLNGMPRVSVVERTTNYLRAECQSGFFRFVDDVEFLIDEQNSTLHFRSASRLGHSDLGVNRARMEEFSDRFRSTQK